MDAIKYPSIGQFRNLVKDVQFYYKENLPVLKFRGTVKVHGTNASVVINADGTQTPQSRNNVLTLQTDNCGFANWHHTNRHHFDSFAEQTFQYYVDPKCEAIIVYGEWAGRGVQPGVAVSEVDRFFYVFAVKAVDAAGDTTWLRNYPGVPPTVEFLDARAVWGKEISIDFNTPGLSQNELVETTQCVEKECPVGKAKGVSGIGEGVVWEHITLSGERFACKVKGEKHSASKVRKLAEVDTEKLNSIDEFVAYAVTENRLRQGLAEVCGGQADRALLGVFIKWVSADVHKEESDTLEASGLTMRDVGGTLSRRARNWFFAQESL